MRLLSLDEETMKWTLQKFTGPKVPFYAVLSHTWASNRDEVKYEDIADGRQRFSKEDKSGYQKLRFCYKRAKADGLRYFWIDTCCIKKSDSSELQRSLSSMFYWYQRAARCYVFLSDVSIRDSIEYHEYPWEFAFSKSRWFKRGWTLQELLAPGSLQFFSKESKLIGDKSGLVTMISKITRIPGPALEGLDLSRYSIEERLMWAKDRKTSVPEDSAYCLIGIFDVELHMLYADGDPDKRQTAALAYLHKAIAEKRENTKVVKELIRIGGASWPDLTTLSTERLADLDEDLQSYLDWVLKFQSRHLLETVSDFSLAAGKRMQELLARFGVGYEDESATPTRWPEGKLPWAHFTDPNALPHSRLQALADNRLFWRMRDENSFTLFTALRTLEALMIWRGQWQERA